MPMLLLHAGGWMRHKLVSEILVCLSCGAYRRHAPVHSAGAEFVGISQVAH